MILPNLTKDDIIRLCSSMNIQLDYDQWDVEDKGWMRFRYGASDEVFIYYKDYVDTVGFSVIGEYLRQIGRDSLRKEYKELMNIQ